MRLKQVPPEEIDSALEKCRCSAASREQVKGILSIKLSEQADKEIKQ